MFEYLYM